MKASPEGARAIKGVLALYEIASGQIVNASKSSIAFSPNTRQEVCREVKEILEIQNTQPMLMYLGLPTFTVRHKRVQFGYIRDRIQMKLNGWNHKDFSAGGREVLLKAVIQAIPTYTMQCFKLPNSICDDIERLCAAFWWGDKENNKCVHWKRWEMLCKPKYQGGIGFRDIKKFNDALLAKQLWRMMVNPELLVAKVFKAKYSRDSDMMEATAKKGCSFIWRSIIGSKGVLAEGARCKLGNGKNIRVFGDCWVEGDQVRLLRGTSERVDVQMRVRQLFSEEGGWDEQKVDGLFHEREREAILNTACENAGEEDRRWWRFEPIGKFSVRTCYLAQKGMYTPHEHVSEEDRRVWSKAVWQVPIPPKVKVFMWRACSNIVPAMGNLRVHHVPVDRICELCKNRWASTEHALIYCPFVRGIWKQSRFWRLLKGREMVPLMDIALFLEKELEGEEYAVWCIMVWKVWCFVCNVVHGDGKAIGRPREVDGWSLMEAFEKARVSVYTERGLGVECGDRKWVKPPEGVMRVDVDAMFNVCENRFGVGVIMRDWKGNVRAALTKKMVRRANIMTAEAMAVIEGIILGIKAKVEVITIYTDSLLVARLMAREDEYGELLPDDFGDMLKKAKESMLVGVFHMYRTANRVAHLLAKKSYDYVTDMFWEDDFPRWLRDIVRDDISG